MSKTVEKLDEIGLQSLVWLKDFAEKGVEFVQAQAPDLCREIVNLGLWQWGFLAIMWACISCVALYALRCLYKSLKRDWRGDGSAEVCFIFASLAACIPVGFTFASLYNFITIYAAPKVYLLNYFVDLYRRTK